MSLTDKQRAFVDEYLKDFNATRAAKAAGYSAKTAMEQGYQLLQNPSVQNFIQERYQQRRNRHEITVDRVIDELALIAYADMKDYATIEPGGSVTLKPFEEMPEGASRAISKIKEKRKELAEAEGEGKSVIIENQLEFGHWDKVKALELIGKHLGIFQDKLQLSGAVTNIHAEAPQFTYTDLHGWTEDEKTIFLATGEVPERYR